MKSFFFSRGRALLLAVCGYVCWISPSAGEDTPCFESHPIPPGFMLVEGDMIVPTNAWPPASRHQAKSPPFLEASGLFGSTFWPNGVVPYVFDDAFRYQEATNILSCMRILESISGVRWRPRDGDADYVHFQGDAAANNSYVGCRAIGKQTINIYNWNYPYKIIHEMLHTLGFYHEHCRADRDQYIRIYGDRIVDGTGWDENFGVQGNIYGPYDFDSVMHYGACDFATWFCTCDTNNAPYAWTPNAWTIEVLPPYYDYWQPRIGQRSHISFWDERILSFIYSYAAWTFVNQNAHYIPGATTGNFSFPYPDLHVAITNTVPTGTIWFPFGGTYTNVKTINKRITLRAAWQNVSLK